MKMTRKAVSTVIIYAVLIFLGYLLGCLTQRIRQGNYKNVLYEKIDSLSTLNYLRDEKSLPYYNLTKDSVLGILPPETKRFDILSIYDGADVGLSYGAYNVFVEKVKNTKDTICVQKYYWNVPFSNMSKLYIVFELQKDSSWVAKSCAQWDSNRVYLD